MLIVIPAFNEQESLPGVVAEVRRSAPLAAILVVDDGSADQTSSVARAAGADVVTLPFNLGVGGALRTGFRYAKRYGHEQLVQVDADGQHDPAEIATLAELLSEADLVIGTRFGGSSAYKVDPLRRIVMRLLARLLSRRAKVNLTDVTSGFRAFGPRAISLFAHEYPAEYLGDTVEALIIATREGLTVREVPVRMRERAGGAPSHSSWKAGVMLVRTIPAFLLRRPHEAVASVDPGKLR
jgi:glycosyltransferase involved in cell wall biosynthesis